MNAPFRLGIIGGGRMGRTHLRAVSGSAVVSVVAVAEAHRPTAEQLREHGLTVYSSAGEMFAGADLDGVLIAVPTPHHIDTTRSALEVGVPVLCEKPFGLDPERARELGRASADIGLPLQIAYWRRFVPELAALRRALAAGEYGDPHMLICSQWDESPPPASFRRDSGGIFVDMGVHEIDQLLWLLDQDITDVRAQAFPTTEDPAVDDDVDSAQALIMLSGGTSAVVSLGRFHRGGDLVSAQLFGSRDHADIGIVSPATGERPQLTALRLQAEAFASYVGGAAAQGASAEDAARVLEVAGDLTRAAVRPVHH